MKLRVFKLIILKKSTCSIKREKVKFNLHEAKRNFKLK